MKITFESKPICGEDVEYIKTKIKMYAKKCQKKKHHANIYQ